MRLLRELSRRKLRTALTITGITIGIWALVVFSSMANKINDLVGMGAEFYADKIVVTDGEAFGTSPMRLVDADAIAEIGGVAAVDPQIELPWESNPSVGFGVPDLLTGIIPGADAGHQPIELELATGRMLTAEDAGNVVVLGSSLAQKHGVVAGGSVEIRGEPFEVLGTLQPTLTWGWPTVQHIGPWSSPVASSSGSRSRELWSTIRASSSATSRRAISIRRAPPRYSPCCAGSTGSAARRSCWSRTIRRSARRATASSACAMDSSSVTNKNVLLPIATDILPALRA